MRSLSLFALLLLSSVLYSSAQSTVSKPDKTPVKPDKNTVVTEPGKASPASPDVQPESADADAKDKRSSSAKADDEAKNDKDDDKQVGLTSTGYIRPNSEKRFKRYVNNVVGPFAWARYSISAGMLTWRNSPEEWGDKWEGFGRRFGNALGKSAIRNTTVYALDEAFKYDSNFYRSRDRSVAARLRNSVFSAVTARNKKGKRVVGVPRLVGNFTSNIISSTTWYPPRYDVVHGIKGGAISIGINVGFNLIREFVWK